MTAEAFGGSVPHDPAFFWMWNDRLELPKLCAQLDDMVAHGIRNVCIHPFPKDFRPWACPSRMEPDYLSDEFLDIVSNVVARTSWTFRKGMPVGLRTEFRQEGRPTELQRVGWRFVWVTPKTDVRYFACGPFDNYSDRKDGCFPARYDARSDRFGFSYGCSQDGGNREDARFVELSDPGIRFSAVDAKRFSFAVSPYSPTELLLENHPELLPPPSKTELGLYAKVRGLGSANCGPEPKREDRVNPDGIYVLDVEVTDAFGRNSARTGSSGIW